MSLLTTVAERIAQARRMEGERPMFPWSSFEEFFTSRVTDRGLSDRTFLIYCDEDRRRAWTYGAFGVAVQEMASYLRERVGLERGDRLATMLFNHDQTVVLSFAAWVSGITVVPINLDESTEKKRFIIEHAEASAVCCWETHLDEAMDFLDDAPSLRHVVVMDEDGVVEHRKQTARGIKPARSLGGSTPAPAPSLEDEALIVYTSGTTGQPKGVVLTVANLLTDADAIAGWHRFGREDRLMCVLPIHHVNGIVVTLVTPFYCGGSVVLNRKFKSGLFWKRMHEEQVTCVSVVPTVLEFLLDADEDLSPYRLDRFGGVICGAGPLLTETARRFEDRFRFPIRHGYGLSETTCYACFLPNDLNPAEHRHWLSDYEFPSIGLPLPHNDMAILDGKGELLPPGARGEICIRGWTVCAGYFKRDDANETAFQWGWFRSGDEGFYERDEQGRPFFFISGRLKELIIRGGVNISPLEIDGVLRSHPAVQFAMAVPFEHRYYGEEIAAYVVLRAGAGSVTEADVRAHCRSRLPFARCPKVILFGHEVPYTSTGKPKRLELKTCLAPILAAYRNHQFRDDVQR
ncbi:class I adenylate-forming enzyme family protein [Candidatus Nitrospira inopinata]|jgi:long-chain acyl-CoA synthetase|uniref:Putative 2-succinylbenzoate--CoA ligase n=1 Tax=Candidatus Nitrospira inopinata TaxID=1715989 RepID=A0A0S4KU52_9BACT|nr:class I adenylate-forming enzyme family protein [Candidatus Nitrospira inopinata]CUQ65908.1 putative 2-succinylbenzoate--CoA ligase [Candidatus Nitrospira inopinata]